MCLTVLLLSGWNNTRIYSKLREMISLTIWSLIGESYRVYYTRITSMVRVIEIDFLLDMDIYAYKLIALFARITRICYA